MSETVEFSLALQQQLRRMEKTGELFRVDIDKDEVWDKYLSSFPEGSNPIYKERTEHDCNCCKQFIRDLGAVVAINDDGEVMSLWDVDIGGYSQVVADALSALVKSKPIVNVYRHYQQKIGTVKNFQQTEDSVIQWDHLNAVLTKPFVVTDRSVADVTGDLKTNFEVLKRSLEEISSEAIEIVGELIAQNSIYRGQEFKAIVTKIKKVKKGYAKADYVDNFLWKTSSELGHAGRFKNTVIGTLLTDISSGVALEDAVKMYESKVAPQNYKRSSALITQGMIKQAQQTVADLGIEDSLQRRYAVEEDITINNVLFADRSTQKKMKSALDDLAPTKTETPSLDKVQEIGIDEFVKDVLPNISSMEVMVQNKHSSNLVSLIAPVHEDAKGIFKWDNNFSWGYNGDITDSDIRSAVAARGGRVDGVFRFSHSRNYDKRNSSLMDLHVFMPGSTKRFTNGMNDSYGNSLRVGWNNRKHSASGGVQDVDYVDPAPSGYVPVENITFPDLKKMPDGDYTCMIHNWNLRQPTKGGFKAEIEFDGQIFEYEVTRPLKHKEWVKVATVTLRKGVFSVEHHLPTGAQSQDVWGITTEKFQKVKMLMNSPNHWDDQNVGNKHWFFMLEGCYNPEQSRGFYNEFLQNDLNKHRKVFEVLAGKMKTEESTNQLSGLGFSSTKEGELLCKVSGSFNRMLKIKF